ncbi:MAG: murein biosynthesis integral membrane protein MurJ [Archangiaceae bacterium]|nr:murein biosynthesis integral membrane protein MurJ [Archangiaceae bacterium]
MPEAPRDSGRGAALVGAGILLSRLLGLVRQRLLAHYFGATPAAAAFLAALRIPNFLQNMLGEGVLSASFIPVYAGLRAKKQDDEAQRVAGEVFGLLAAANAVLVVVGVAAAPVLVTVLAPGFAPQTRELMTDLVRIFFPATGVLVLSAWCLGVLNSHRRFFLSYVAPVVWNLCIIGALLIFKVETTKVAWGVVVGGAMQFLIQLPPTLRLLGRLRPAVSARSEHTRQVLKSFVPAVAARGVVQISAFLDQIWASIAGERAGAVLFHTQTISMLPVSLFGMAIAASELPAMSEEAATRKEALKSRLQAGLERLVFLVIPSGAAFLMLGDVVAAPLLESGHFTQADTRLSWYVLMGSAVGLTASTQGRLFSSAFFALKDTRTPLKFAGLRMAVSAACSALAVLVVPKLFGVPQHLAVAGISAASGLAAWAEYLSLRRAMRAQLGDVGVRFSRIAQLWGAALAAGAAALGVKALLASRFGSVTTEEWGGSVLPAPHLNPIWSAVVVCGVFGVVYFALTPNVWKKVLRRRSLK